MVSHGLARHCLSIAPLRLRCQCNRLELWNELDFEALSCYSLEYKYDGSLVTVAHNFSSLSSYSYSASDLFPPMYFQCLENTDTMLHVMLSRT
jgi:hypothetical protein